MCEKSGSVCNGKYFSKMAKKFRSSDCPGSCSHNGRPVNSLLCNCLQKQMKQRENTEPSPLDQRLVTEIKKMSVTGKVDLERVLPKKEGRDPRFGHGTGELIRFHHPNDTAGIDVGVQYDSASMITCVRRSDWSRSLPTYVANEKLSVGMLKGGFSLDKPV